MVKKIKEPAINTSFYMQYYNNTKQAWEPIRQSSWAGLPKQKEMLATGLVRVIDDDAIDLSKRLNDAIKIETAK